MLGERHQGKAGADKMEEILRAMGTQSTDAAMQGEKEGTQHIQWNREAYDRAARVLGNRARANRMEGLDKMDMLHPHT